MSISKKFVTIALALIASICLAVVLFTMPSKSTYAEVVTLSDRADFDIDGIQVKGLSDTGKEKAKQAGQNGYKIVLPSDVTTVNDEAFKDCIYLKEITIPQNITVIGLNAFYNCSGLATINYYAKSASVQYHAFALPQYAYGISKVTVNIGSKDCEVNKLPSGLFYRSDGETAGGHKGVVAVNFNNVNLPDGENEQGWGYDVFKNCTSLATVTFENCNIPLINRNAFEGCTSLNKVAGLENIGLKTVKTEAFKGCSSLFHVTISENVGVIETDAFDGCERLIEVVILSNAIKAQVESDKTAYGKVAYYALAVYGKDDNVTTNIVNKDGFNFITVQESNTNVTYLLGYTGNDTQLTLPTGYPDASNPGYKIYKKAFYLNTNVTSITIKNESNVINIGDSAFAYCTSLRDVTFPATLADMGANALQGCTALTNVTFEGNAPQTISANTFNGCSSLVRMDLKGTKYIGHSAFEGCSQLTVVDFGTVLVTIEGEAFLNCSRLSLVKLPETVERVDTDAFKGCSSLSVVYLPADRSEATKDTTVAYGDGVFTGCADDLLLISASMEQYAKDIEKDNLKVYDLNLTYQVVVKLYYEGGDALPDSSGKKHYTVYKLYNRNGGYTKGENNSTWTLTSSMPVESDYSYAVWYKEESHTTKVTIDDLTRMLEERVPEISLYAHYIEKPALTARIGTEAAVYEENMNYDHNAVLTNCLKLDGYTINDPNQLNAAYRYNIEAHYLVNGNLDENWDKKVNQAGTYTLHIDLDPEQYGVWAEDFYINFEIKPKEVDISEIGLTWTTEGGSLNSEPGLLYFYGSNNPFTSEQSNEGSYTGSKTVVNSYVIYTGNEIKIKLSGSNLENYADSWKLDSNSDTSATKPGTYTVTATIKANNNYKIVYREQHPTPEELTRQGMTFVISDSTVEVTKVWYIARSTSNHLMNDGGTGMYALIDTNKIEAYDKENRTNKLKDYIENGIAWTYPRDDKEVAYAKLIMPIKPTLSQHGELADQYITFTVELNGLIIGEEKTSLSNFERYFNSSMPAGKYKVTFYIGDIPDPEVDNGKIPGDSNGKKYEFVIGEAKLLGDKIGEFDKAFTSQRIVNIAYSGAVTFASTDVISIIDNQSMQMTPAGIWADYSGYYNPFEIVYFVKEGAKDNFVNDPAPTTYYSKTDYNNGNVTGAIPREIGTYTVFYKVSAPNYGDDVIEDRYELNIQIGITPTVKNVSFTRSSVIGTVIMGLDDQNLASRYIWDYCYIYTLDEDYNTAPSSIINHYGNDTYVNLGKHFIFIQIKPSVSKYVVWGDNVNSANIERWADNGYMRPFLKLEFEIEESSNLVISTLSVNSWEYGAFTRENNAPNWQLSSYDYSQYVFVLISEKNEKYYFYGDANKPLGSNKGFDVAPAGKYTLKAYLPDANDPEIELVSASIENVVIAKATPKFASAPIVSSWTYGNYTAGKADPSMYTFAFNDEEIRTLLDIRYCTAAAYGSPNRAPVGITALINKAGQVPIGTYYLVFTLKANNNYDSSWSYGVRFEVFSDQSYNRTYGDFAGGGIDASHFGDSGVVIQYLNVADSSGQYLELDKFPYFTANGFAIGEYKFVVRVNGTLTYSGSFKVSKAANSWTTLPSIVGWEQGNYSPNDNRPKAEAAFGEVTYTITGDDGRIYTLQDANILKAGKYVLTVNVEGTDNWEGLSTVVYFSVTGNSTEDEGSTTGLSVAVIIFAVLAVSLAVAGIIVLVISGNKANAKHKSAKKEPGRK